MNVEAPVQVISIAGPRGRTHANAARHDAAVPSVARVPWRRRLRQRLYRQALRLAMLAYHVVLRISQRFGRRPRPRRPDEGLEILLTGTFHSDNWINAHLRPLAASAACARVVVVATCPVAAAPNVTFISPPPWLRRGAGAVGARLLTFLWIALRRRPHFVGGFHLLLNGLVAAVAARLAGARAIYFCVGGPAEVLGGGIQSENRLFGRLSEPDPVLERRLIRAVSAFDLVITMGTRAVAFFRAHGVNTRFHVVSGGIEHTHFLSDAGGDEMSSDIILVGRLAEIKRIDVFLRALQRVASEIPSVRALIVGDGQERASLEALARELGVDQHVTFAGQRRDVGALLRHSRLFVLTSDTEGLALSLMEAMTCGLPAVVSDVGDLADLVQDGVNGYLVPPRAVEQFAARMVELLSDGPKLARFAAAARASAQPYERSRVVRQWDEILADCP